MKFTFNRFDPAKPIRFHAPDNNDGSGGGGGGNNAEPNAGGGNGSNPNNGGSNPNDNPANRKAEIANAVQEALQGLLGKNNGDKDATLEQLIKKNHGLELQRDEARANALSKEDKAAFEAFKALNLSPADLKRIVAEYGTMSEEKAKATKTSDAKAAAKVAGINGDLLVSLDGAMGVEYITTGEGDKAVATVKFKDASGAEQVKPLADWAKEKWPALEAALVATDGEDAGKKTGVPFPKGAPAGSGAKKTIFDEIRERNAKAAEKKPTLLELAKGAGMIKE